MNDLALSLMNVASSILRASDFSLNSVSESSIDILLSSGLKVSSSIVAAYFSFSCSFSKTFFNVRGLGLRMFSLVVEAIR